MNYKWALIHHFIQYVDCSTIYMRLLIWYYMNIKLRLSSLRPNISSGHSYQVDFKPFTHTLKKLHEKSHHTKMHMNAPNRWILHELWYNFIKIKVHISLKNVWATYWRELRMNLNANFMTMICSISSLRNLPPLLTLDSRQYIN